MVQEKIDVTIFLIVYNQKETIVRAIDGILEQKTKYKYKIIIHDDCSNDGTADILREYKQKYPDIIEVIYETKNQYSKGVNIFYDILLQKLTTKYWCILEGDDYWCYDKKIEEALDFLEKNIEYNCYVTDCIYKEMFGQRTCTETQSYKYSSDKPNITPENYCYFHTTARIYKKDEKFTKYAKKYISGWDGNIYFYYLFFGKIYFIPKITSVWDKSKQNGLYSSKSSVLQQAGAIIEFYNLKKTYGEKVENFCKKRIAGFRFIEKYIGTTVTWYFLYFISQCIRSVDKLKHQKGKNYY